MTKCKCVYATARNSSDVRNGYQTSGSLIKRCDKCQERLNYDKLSVIPVISLLHGLNKTIDALAAANSQIGNTTLPDDVKTKLDDLTVEAGKVVYRAVDVIEGYGG